MADFDPIAAGATLVDADPGVSRPVFNSGSTAGSSKRSPEPEFDPLAAGAKVDQGQPEFDPMKAGASFADPKDIEERANNDPTYTPSNDDLRSLYDYKQNRTFGEKATDVAKGAGEAVTGAVGSAVRGVKHTVSNMLPGSGVSPIDQGKEDLANIGEGASQAATGLLAFPYKLIKAPLSYLGHSVQDTFDPLGADDRAYNRWKDDYLYKRELAKQSNVEALQRAVGIDNPVKPNPDVAATLSLAGQIAVPEALLGGAGKLAAATEAAGKGNALTQAAIKAGGVVEPTSTEAALSTAGSGVAGVGKAVQTVAGAPRALIQSVAEKVAGPEYGGNLAAAAEGAALGHIPAVGALAGAEGAGAGLSHAGQIVKLMADQGAAGPFGRLVGLAKNPDAPMWMKNLASMPAIQTAYGAASKLATAATGAAKGAVKGAVTGAAVGALSGDSPEELGGDIGAFGAFGGFHEGASANSRKAFARRAAGLTTLVGENLGDGVKPETLAKVPDAAMLAASDIPYLGIKDAQGRDLKVRFADATDMGTAAHTDGYYDPLSHTLVMNADNLSGNPAAWSSTFHELLHPLMESSIANKPELASTIDAAVKSKGLTLDQAKQAYAERLLAPELDQMGLAPDQRQQAIDSYIQSQDNSYTQSHGDPNHWIRSELLAEAGRHAMGTKEAINSPTGAIADLLKPEATGVISGVLRSMGIGLPKPGEQLARTVIPGFEEVAADPSMRSAVRELLKNSRDSVPGVEKGSEPTTPLTPADMGTPKAPVYPLSNGRKGNKYSEIVPDGKGGEKTVMRNPKQVKALERRESKAIGKYVKPGQRVGALPPAFFADPDIGPWTKAAATEAQRASVSGEALQAWYHGVGKSGDVNWKASVRRNLGNVVASHQEFYPMPDGLFMSKAGNALMDTYSLLAFDRKAQAWVNRSGPLSLERWNGDIDAFRKDVNTYNQNHAQGLPGDANNLGSDKRDVINAFLYGRNAKHEAANPLRKLLRNAEDRQGIVRSLRLDRLETMEPLKTDVVRPNYQKGVKNFSPQADEGMPELINGDRMVTIRKADGTTYRAAYGDKKYDMGPMGVFHSISKAKEGRWSHGMLGKDESIIEGNTPDQAAASVVDQAAVEPRPEAPVMASPKALSNAVGDESIPLVHLSSQSNLKVVDPKFFGKGKANTADTRGGNKSYFFVKGSKLGGDEPIFGQGGHTAHTGEVNGKKIYDLRIGKPDPENYFKTINREEADDNLQAAGYHGVMVETGDGRKVVMMFKPVKVSPVGAFKGKRVMRSPEAQPARSGSEDVRKIASEYVKATGVERPQHTGYAPLNPDLGKRVADFYDSASHNPTDPDVRASYAALRSETDAQWKAAEKAGYTFEPWTKPGQPYKNSAEMREDVQKNKHLYYFPTEGGFGSGGDSGKGEYVRLGNKSKSILNSHSDVVGPLTPEQAATLKKEYPKSESKQGNHFPFIETVTPGESDKVLSLNDWLDHHPSPSFKEMFPASHPMLEPSSIRKDGKRIPVNDVFRAVHDFYGHAKEGYEFGPRGELNAFLSHSGMYSDKAVPAMAMETMGQNSWVNFGKHLRNAKGEIPTKGQPGYKGPLERPYADQKAGMLEPGLLKESLASGAEAKQYSPMTEAGKALEKSGYKIEEENYGTGIVLTLRDKSGVDSGHISVVQKSPTSADVELVSIPQRLQRQGIGETLYREMGARLQKAGVTELSGTTFNPDAVVPLRKKVFGSAHEVVSSRSTPGVKVLSSDIEPGRQFSPKAASTESGKALEKKGYTFHLEAYPGGFDVHILDKNGTHSGYIAIEDTKKGGLVSNIQVPEDLQQKGIGEALYREAASELQQKGATRLEGITDPNGPIPSLRKKVFGNVAVKGKRVTSVIEPDRQFSPKAQAPELPDDKVIGRYAKRIAAATTSGGASFDVKTGKSIGKSPAFGVSIYPDRSEILTPAELTPERVAAFIKTNADLLTAPDNVVGTWFDKDSGKVYLDVSTSFKDAELAKYAGWKYNQKAIWDSKEGKEIPTGGNGEPVEAMPPAAERIALLKHEYELQNPKTGQVQLAGMGRLVLDPKGDEVRNVRDLEAMRPDRELTDNERAASDLARKEVRQRVQLLDSVDDKVQARRALIQGVTEVSEMLEKQLKNSNFDNGAGWYGRDIAKMEETTKKVFPETTSPDKMTMFKLLLASFSGGATPKENYQLASEAFATYLKTGEIPSTSAFRISEAGAEKKLGRMATMTAEKLSDLMDKTGGEAGLVKYLLSKHETTLLGNQDAYGALDLGPKFGRFFLNLMGHSSEVTIDLWATRTWRRWMGTPFNRVKEGKTTKMELADAPTDKERNLAIEAFGQIAKHMNNELPEQEWLTPMAVQAMLWFYEKDLYASRGVRVDRGTFSSASEAYAKKPLHKNKAPVVTGAKHPIDPNQGNLFK